MVQIKAAYLERELMRGMRPDARNFLRPDWRRDIQPRSASVRIRPCFIRALRK